LISRGIGDSLSSVDLFSLSNEPPGNKQKKQAAKHLRPELIEAVGKAGYEIVPVVPGKLAEAGRLDALLHKIRTPGKRKRGLSFSPLHFLLMP